MTATGAFPLSCAAITTPAWGRWLRAVLLPVLCSVAVLAQPAPNTVVRIGFSTRSLANANRTDVMAAMKAWLLTLTKERNLSLQADPQVFDSVTDMERAIRFERIDVFSAPTDEFVLLEKVGPVAKLFASSINGKLTEQYVVLVSRDHPAQELKDLRGESLVVLDHPRTSLALIWLDTELLRRKLPTGAKFFAKTTHVTKPNLAILPVFFKQMGAALVTRAGFETAAELNPQLAKSLRVLLTAPELIPSVGAFRANAVTGAVETYRREALRLRETQGGRLVLNLFQTDGVVEIKDSDLAATRALLDEHARLVRGSPRP